jgi:hypothetical protein
MLNPPCHAGPGDGPGDEPCYPVTIEAPEESEDVREVWN